MELGKASLRRCGINILYNAVHSKYGLAWTDGRGVYLTPVRIKDECVEREDSLKLGEFECVQSLHWSCEGSSSACYLCLVHEGTVSLWRVSGIAPDLHLKQVRKINATPVPQGVLWSPNRDILCILNRDRASFYFKHCQSKGSYALPPIESGKITCGCWSLDGKKLLVGIGSIVLIYQWDDIAKSLSDYTLLAWKIPSVDGRLTTLTALSNTWMVGSVELPLESLCHAAHSDMLRLPDSPDNFQSRASKLFNLQNNNVHTQQTAQLVIFEVPYSQKEPRKIAGAPLRTVVSPDLIHYDPTLRRVTIGSNTQPVLQVFQVTDTQLWKIQEIRFAADERPKGLCGLTVHSGSNVQPEGVLVMVGSVQDTDSAFLPSSTRTTFRLSFTFHPYRNPDLTVLEKLVAQAGGESMNAVSLDSNTSDSILRELQLPTSNTKVHLLRINPLRQDSSQSEINHLNDGDLSPAACSQTDTTRRRAFPNTAGLELLLPGNMSISRSQSHGAKVLVVDATDGESNGELEIEQVSFEDNMPNFVNSLDKITNQTPLSLRNDGKALRQRGTSCPEGIKSSDIIRGHYKGKQLDSPSEASVSSDNSNVTSTRPRMVQRGPSLESDPLSARDRASSELPQQVASLESQISAQGVQIGRLNERLDYMSRLLEETSMVAANQYQPLSSPEVIRVVLDPQDDDEVSVTKIFILDNSRLQLEPIKQTFGLLTVEIIINGEPSVVGSNVDGYLPIKFQPNDTIHITGRRATEMISRPAFISSTI